MKFIAQQLSTKHRMELPIWNHIGTVRKPVMTKEVAKCLRENHKLYTVGKALMSVITAENTPYHREWDPWCPCDFCTALRKKGCFEPKRCLEAQANMLELIHENFDPSELIDTKTKEPDYKNLTRIREGQIIPFSMASNNIRHLSENLRIFSEPQELAEEREPEAPENTEEPPHIGTIPMYTDGSCANNGTRSARAGSGIWFGENNPRNLSIRVGDNLPQSNNT
ncbi:hypothetical protein DL93DRAFT_2194272, partial [Clavulina sp. PMI_390]